jgi:DNA-binding PadR family transcriptional regulator
MRRRMFDGGELRLVLLLLMEAQARHGYDLIREVETRTGGAYVPSPGIVYPTLTLLDEQGFIQAAVSEGAKRAFTLTAEGRAFLEQNRDEADACLKRLEALGSESSRTEAGPVWRAMQNLKAALAQRLSGAPDKELLFKVADALDEAARTIERLP